MRSLYYTVQYMNKLLNVKQASSHKTLFKIFHKICPSRRQFCLVCVLCCEKAFFGGVDYSLQTVIAMWRRSAQ